MPRKEQQELAKCIQTIRFDWAPHWTTLELQRKNKPVAMQLLLGLTVQTQIYIIACFA
jgi:hypothetical protein